MKPMIVKYICNDPQLRTVAVCYEAALRAKEDGKNFFEALAELSDLNEVRTLRAYRTLGQLGALASDGLHPALERALNKED